MHRTLAAVLILALAGCGSSEPGPGGVTANEAAALDDAAEMVEAKRLDDAAVRPATQGEAANPAAQPAPASK